MAKFVTSSFRCQLLKSVAALKQLNLIDETVKRDVDLTPHRFGLSLHLVWIRLFEYLVHILYRLEIENGMHEREKINEIYKIRTKNCSTPLQNEMGLLVDKVKPGGSGTPNDGNIARSFFF